MFFNDITCLNHSQQIREINLCIYLQTDFESTTRAEALLDNFCSWQKKFKVQLENHTKNDKNESTTNHNEYHNNGNNNKKDDRNIYKKIDSSKLNEDTKGLKTKYNHDLAVLITRLVCLF